MYLTTASNVIRSLLQGGYTKVNIDEAIEMAGLVRHIAYKNCSQYTVTQHTCIHSSTQWCGLHRLHMVISTVTGPAGNRLGGGAAATVAENW